MPLPHLRNLRPSADIFSPAYLVGCHFLFSKSSCILAKPSSVNIIDFAFPWIDEESLFEKAVQHAPIRSPSKSPRRILVIAERGKEKQRENVLVDLVSIEFHADN